MVNLDGSESTVAGSWSSGRVLAFFDLAFFDHSGGLIGLHEGGQIEESWSLSEIIDGFGGGLGGGLVGSRTSALAATNSYWSVETSGLTVSGDGVGVDTLQTLTVGQLSSLYWDLGETPDSDFPLLADLSAVEQAIGIGRGMLRLRSVNGGEILSSFADNEIDESNSLLRLDLNGAAENTAGQGRTSTPECSLHRRRIAHACVALQRCPCAFAGGVGGGVFAHRKFRLDLRDWVACAAGRGRFAGGCLFVCFRFGCSRSDRRLSSSALPPPSPFLLRPLARRLRRKSKPIFRMRLRPSRAARRRVIFVISAPGRRLPRTTIATPI